MATSIDLEDRLLSLSTLILLRLTPATPVRKESSRKGRKRLTTTSANPRKVSEVIRQRFLLARLSDFPASCILPAIFK